MRTLTADEVEQVSGGMRAGMFWEGMGFGILGAAALAAAPFTGGLSLAAWGFGAGGGVLALGGSALIGMSLA